MSLRDLACYTLTLRPLEQNSKVTELVSVENGREEHRFARVREVKDGEAYSSSIYGMSSMQSSKSILCMITHAIEEHSMDCMTLQVRMD